MGADSSHPHSDRDGCNLLHPEKGGPTIRTWSQAASQKIRQAYTSSPTSAPQAHTPAKTLLRIVGVEDEKAGNDMSYLSYSENDDEVNLQWT